MTLAFGLDAETSAIIGYRKGRFARIGMFCFNETRMVPCPEETACS
jgi:hypothetical protein